MKIQIHKGKPADVSETCTRVVFVEKGVERLVREDGIDSLHIVSGKLDKITPRTFRTLMRTIIQSAKRNKLSEIAIELSPEMFPKTSMYDANWFWSTVAENLILAEYEHTQYKSIQPKDRVEEVCIVTNDTESAKRGIERGCIVGEYANVCRDIANTTGGDMTPEKLGNIAKKICKNPKTKVTVLDLNAIKKLGMGGLIGVGQGAKAKPRFIVIEYNALPKGKKAKEGPVVLVGKGITFDTGGLQVKPGMSMYEMHMDMSGGASVIATLGAIAKLGLQKHIVGLIPAAENAISDEAMRPGDVLTMMSGKTVEVLHTDAEGRLILADALHYARKYNPSLVVDVATLTGAAGVAVGQHANVILTKSRVLEDSFRELGEESGDYTFPLPLWDEYMQYTKGTHADISNIASGDSRYGGTINGAAFLAHFTKKMKWVHIDMAPRMTSVPSDKLAKGATGEPVRLLVKIAEAF